MEPCLFRHGKADGWYLRSDIIWSLQWSHVFSDMVRERPPEGGADPRRGASMEPCLFRHGKNDGRCKSPETKTASMEPCLFRHGKSIRRCESDVSTYASMEPCLFRHGKLPSFS